MNTSTRSNFGGALLVLLTFAVVGALVLFIGVRHMASEPGVNPNGLSGRAATVAAMNAAIEQGRR